MAFLSCKLFWIDPKYYSEVLQLLTKGKHVYDETGGENLYLFAKQTAESEYGKSIEVFYDQMISIPVMDPNTELITHHLVKRTEGPFHLHLFEKDPLVNVLGVFSNIFVANKIRHILVKAASDMLGKIVYSLSDVKFLLQEKEKDIREIAEFSDISEVKVEDARDLYVEDVWLKGSSLSDSQEYKKFITDPNFSGKIKFIAFSYNDRVYYLIDDGRIFTRQAGTVYRIEHQYIFEILKNLIDVGAVYFC